MQENFFVDIFSKKGYTGKTTTLIIYRGVFDSNRKTKRDRIREITVYKKKISSVLAMLLAATVTVTSCGGTETGTTAASSGTDVQTETSTRFCGPAPCSDASRKPSGSEPAANRILSEICGFCPVHGTAGLYHWKS